METTPNSEKASDMIASFSELKLREILARIENLDAILANSQPAVMSIADFEATRKDIETLKALLLEEVRKENARKTTGTIYQI